MSVESITPLRPNSPTDSLVSLQPNQPRTCAWFFFFSINIHNLFPEKSTKMFRNTNSRIRTDSLLELFWAVLRPRIVEICRSQFLLSCLQTNQSTIKRTRVKRRRQGCVPVDNWITRVGFLISPLRFLKSFRSRNRWYERPNVATTEWNTEKQLRRESPRCSFFFFSSHFWTVPKDESMTSLRVVSVTLRTKLQQIPFVSSGGGEGMAHHSQQAHLTSAESRLGV